MAKWELYSDNEYCKTFKQYSSDRNVYTSFSINKELKIISLSSAYFVFKDGCTWEAQQADREEMRHTCKYGHWQSDIVFLLSEEDWKFMSNEFRKVIGDK